MSDGLARKGRLRAAPGGGSSPPDAASPPDPSPRGGTFDPFHERVRARPLLIGVPLHARPDLAERVVGSLIACAAEIAALKGEVVLYDDGPEHPALARALDGLLPRARAAMPCRREANPRNLGFVRTANRALEEAVERGFDAVLLNSDAVLTPGALSEMARVALLDPMIGFVNPRSNNATLATLPFQDRFRHLPPRPARRAWAAVARRLPPYSYAPTCNGFCVLVRWTVLAEFGGFDEIFGLGYNEENDLAMRAGRRGYRAVLANHAFVWHEGSGSFGAAGEAAAALEARNRRTLVARYPEYPRLTEHHFRSPEQRAELLLGALIPDRDGRLDVALDFSSFTAAHNGTFEAGAQLLAGAARCWSARFNLFVLCSADVFDVHGYGRFGVERREPHGAEVYAAIFRVGQPYDPGALDRLALKAAVFGVSMLDTLSLDCSQLSDPLSHQLWAWACEHADLIVTTSVMADAQLTRRLPMGRDVLRVRSLHSLDLADYRLPVGGAEEPPAPGYVLVVGNRFAHKDVAAAVEALAADPGRRIVALGGEGRSTPPVDAGAHAPRGLREASNVLRLPAGGLAPERMGALYAGAAAVVFPTHYEGFGMPLLNALAARRPVIVRALPVFQELSEALGGEANIHAFTTLAELPALLSPPPAWDPAGASPGRPDDALRAARDIGEALEAAIARADYARIVRRIRHRPWTTQVAAPPTPRAFVADAVGRGAARAAAGVLALPGVFPALRFAVRALRRLRSPVGGPNAQAAAATAPTPAARASSRTTRCTSASSIAGNSGKARLEA